MTKDYDCEETKMSNSISISKEQLVAWAERLGQISDPEVRYNKNVEVMKSDVISHSRETAEVVRDQICEIIDE